MEKWAKVIYMKFIEEESQMPKTQGDARTYQYLWKWK